MKIAVIGASRGIGRQVVTYALSREHSVIGFARSIEKLDIEDPNFTAVSGDATDGADISAAIDGADAVIMTLGVPRSMKVVSKTTLFSDATRNVIDAMQEHGTRRLLAVTGFGAGDSYDKLSSIEKIGFKAVLGRAYADKSVQEDLIKASDLDWTIARPGILSDNQMSKTYETLVDPNRWRNGVISRADVAHFLVHAVEDGTFIGDTPVLQR